MTPTSTDPTTATPERSAKEPKVREVTIAVAPPENGRMRITILAVPTANLDANGGVFVDLRLGKKDPADMPLVFDASVPHITSIASGDAAVDALAKVEIAADEAAAQLAAEEPGADAPADPAAVAPRKRRSVDGKYPILSHQIGPALKLTIGQSESLRAELAAPAAPTDGERWYARARFASNEGTDLRSAWVSF